MMQQHMDMDQEGFDGRGGAMVEEAKRLMQQDQEENQVEENSGPKIKMNKIGGKKKKSTTAAKSGAPEGAGAKSDPVMAGLKKAEKSLSSGAGFSEQDIEFMKKAI